MKRSLISRIFSFLRSTLRRLRCFLPSRLPVGRTEFNRWADKLIEIYKLPNNDSMRFAIATVILHGKPQDFYLPMEFYGRTMLKGCANQVAHCILEEMKANQKARVAAEAEAIAKVEEENKRAEATATTQAVLGEPIQE